MKVLFFCNLVPAKVGAFEVLLEHLALVFRRNGDVLHLVPAGEPVAAVANRWTVAGMTWTVIQGWNHGNGETRPWGFCVPALELLKKHKPDVAVAHFGNELPTAFVALASRLAGCAGTKWVWQQDQQIRDPGLLTAVLNRMRVAGAVLDHFVAVYDGGRESLIKRGIPARKISVVYNSIAEPVRTKPPGWLRKQLGIPEDAFVIANIGGHIRRKRIDLLLKVFEKVNANCSREVHLVQVGEGPETVNYGAERIGQSAWRTDSSTTRQPGNFTTEQKRVACGSKEEEGCRIHFLGLRNDVADVVGECDCYVHTSEAETCTYAVTESMAAGIPAVVMEAGAAREQVVDGATGYVVARGDVEGMVGAIVELANDADLRMRMGKQARERWRERYRVEVAAERYYQIYVHTGNSSRNLTMGRREKT